MRKFVSSALAALIATSALAAGEVYRWKDANGTWHYSDQPRPGAELVRRTGGASTTPAPSAPPPPATPQTVATSEAPQVSDQIASQVRAEAAAAKDDQCKKAEEYYQSAIRHRTIYRTDEAGNRTYLTDAEIDAERLRARSVRDQACGN